MLLSVSIVIAPLSRRRISAFRLYARLASSWEIHQTQKCGRVMMATCEILPGSEVLTEKCLLFIDNDKEFSKDIERTSKSLNVQEDLLCIYNSYQSASAAVKLQVDNCFCPKSGTKANEIINASKLWRVDDELRANLVKLATIMSFNSFDDDEGCKLFNLTSIFSHSCLPNCTVHFHDLCSTVRAILPIRAGDELTISYDPQHTNKPTHERRAYLLRSKEFLCECPRCTSVGDDTRQFTCFDPKCAGRHLVSQPISTLTPYLLPCSVCNAELSDEYKLCMLSDEKTFSDRYSAVHHQLDTANSSEIATLTAADNLLRFPLLSKHHSFSFDVASEKSMYYSALNQHMKSAVQARLALKSLDSFIAYPSLHVAHAAHTLGQRYEALDTDEGLILARRSYQRAVQLQLLIRGREEGRDEVFDENLLRVSVKLSETCIVAQKSDQCAFCGAVKGTVDMPTACECSVCQSVVYCSEACRALHSKVHIADCKI